MRILQVCVDLDGGGIDRYLYNYCTKISGIQFDFAIVDNNKVGILEQPLLNYGCNIYRLPRLSNGLWQNYQTLSRILKKNKYDAVHIHLGYKSTIALFCAKQNKIKTRIAHAHIAFVPENYWEKLVRKALTPITKFLATDLAACGIDAAKWVWGERAYEAGKVLIHNNAIETTKYQFDNDVRKEYRNKLGIPQDAFVVGHVGRLCDQKNQSRLLDIFAKIHELRPTSYLVLIGRGEQRLLLENKVNTLELTRNVLFLGVRDDVAHLLSTMDVFVFPSKYEGLPFTLIETQCNGLQTLSSDAVTKYVKVSNCITFMSLKEDDYKWAQLALMLGEKEHDHTAINNVKKAGYDINIEAQKLKKYYEEKIDTNTK